MANRIGQSEVKSLPNTNWALLNCQSFLMLYKSGKILPNLVSLLLWQKALKEEHILVNRAAFKRRFPNRKLPESLFFKMCHSWPLFIYFSFFQQGGGTSRLPPPHFLSPLFPTPVRILGSNRAITGATLEVIPWHNNYFCYNILPPMSAFEPRISGIGSDSSANWATTKKSRQKNHWIVETSSGLSKSGLRFSFTLWGSWFMSFEPSASLYMRILWAISEGIITHTHSTSTCSVS